MNIKLAKLIAHSTADGLWEMKDEILVGKMYQIDTDTIQVIEAYNRLEKVFHKRKMVRALDVDKWSWFPLELLEIQNEKN
jgi:hypothetical protein